MAGNIWPRDMTKTKHTKEILKKENKKENYKI